MDEIDYLPEASLIGPKLFDKAVATDLDIVVSEHFVLLVLQQGGYLCITLREFFDLAVRYQLGIPGWINRVI